MPNLTKLQWALLHRMATSSVGYSDVCNVTVDNGRRGPIKANGRTVASLVDQAFATRARSVGGHSWTITDAGRAVLAEREATDAA